MRIIVRITLFSFLLNLIWENLQMPLYFGNYDFFEHFWICFLATIGDVFVVLGIYYFFRFVWKDKEWISNLTTNKLLLTGIAGLIVAIAIEEMALIFGLWNYTSAMPIVPFTSAGLSPVLQMIILPNLIFWIVGKKEKAPL